MYRSATSILLAAVLTSLLAPAFGGSAVAQPQPVPERELRGLEYRSIGPAIMGGRIADLAVDESDPSTFYVCSASGGVWKTTNHGADFTPLFQDEESISCGDVTLAPSNPRVVWVGTGEPQNRQSSPWGAGVYRSNDGGETWTRTGLEETLHIARIRIHPRDPDVVYVAAVGHLWGPNPERGVYRTRDGGESWERVLHVDEHTGAIDLVMDPDDPRTLFAAMYQRRRTGFGFRGGGPGSGIYRTIDGGDTWEELTEGLPESAMGRIGLDVWRGDGEVVYAIVEAVEGEGVYRSTDGGDTWERRSDTNPRPMYYSQIRVDPNDMQRVYLGGTSFYQSHDGGKTFESRRPSGVHVDHHALWIDPHDSDHLLLGNDGGVYASFDRGESWRMYDNIVVSQFYEIGVDMGDPYRVCGGLQDNGSWCGPSRTYAEEGILNRHWDNIYGADGFYTEILPDDPTHVYAEAQNGRPVRVNLATGGAAAVQPIGYPDEEGEDPEDLRWNWNSPLVVSSHDPDVVYYGANYLFRSTDRGQSWDRISPDLTREIDRDTLEIMGKRLEDVELSRNDGISSYGNLTQIAESPLDPDLLYVGTDDGNVQVTRDGGESWTNVVDQIPGLPPRTYVSGLEASSHEPGRVYATFDGHRNDDYRPYVYVSEDHGESWREITAGLPTAAVNRLEEHPRTPELLFLATEKGVWFTLDRGDGWSRLGTGLPNVPVDRVLVHPRENDLVVGTHGRGIWIMDDITPLEHLGEALASELHVFPVRPARTVNRHSKPGLNAGEWAGENPPGGAMIRYRVGPGAIAAAGEDDGRGDDGADAAREAADTSVSLTILDEDGEEIRTLEGPAEEGLHQVVWDLRHDPPYEPDDDGGGFFGSTRGPRVLPGRYAVRVEAGERSARTGIEVEGDPRVRVDRSELLARHGALMSLHRLAGPLHRAEETAEELSDRLDQVRSLLEGRDPPTGELATEVESLAEEVDSLADELDDHSGDVRSLSFSIERVVQEPTAEQEWELDHTWERSREAIERFNELLRDDLPALSRRLADEAVLAPVAEPLEVPTPPGS